MANEGIAIGSDNLFKILPTLCETSAAIESATVAITLKDATTGVDIAGVSWPQPCVESPAGTYKYTAPDTIVVTEGQRVEATFTVDAGGGLNSTHYAKALVKKN